MDAQDGNGKSCSFVQVQGICSVSDTLFTTDAAAGKIKRMKGLSGTTDFLEHRGILCDTFGITCKASTSQPVTPEQVKSLMSKVTNVNPNYKDTIDWKTLLTTIVENLHAASHFKHETFDVLQYATDFGYRRNR